jgi:hypothetical protein
MAKNPTIIRRTLSLAEGRKDDLVKIKQNTPAKTDTAAINDAVMWRARLVGHDLSEIESALCLWEEVKRETKAGAKIFIETVNDPQAGRTRLFVPVLAVG